VSVALEPLARGHLPGVEDLLRDPEVLHFTRVPEPPPADFAETWLSRYESGREEGTRAGLLTEWALEELGMLRLELLIDVENDASKRVAERSGYRREGVLRSVHLKQDRREDTEIWSRLATDPEP
jgi:hypothetical protein